MSVTLDTVASLNADARANVHEEETLLRPQASKSAATIMVVDDEPINIEVVTAHLNEAGYERCSSITDSRQAVDAIRKNRPDLVILDIMMPHVSGLDIIEVVRGDTQLHHIPILVLSASGDNDVELEALHLGATDFLNKPVKAPQLVARVRNMLIAKTQRDQLATYSSRLEEEVRQRTVELDDSRREVIRVLASAAEYRDQETGRHVVRVGKYAAIVARQYGCDVTTVELIEHAAVLHDVGKLGVPDAILLKPGRLDPEELSKMHEHCYYGERIMRGLPYLSPAALGHDRESAGPSRSPILEMAATIALSHHEKWDGSGYPCGLAGEAIPLEGRITAVADVFDALGSRRPYKEPIPMDRCFDILEEGRGQHFDPAVLDAFFGAEEQIAKVAIELADV